MSIGRRSRREIGQPLVHLIADVPRHGLDRERRQQVARLTGRGDDQPAAASTVGGFGATGEAEDAQGHDGDGSDPSHRERMHAYLVNR